jgi:hypothetical protein
MKNWAVNSEVKMQSFYIEFCCPSQRACAIEVNSLLPSPTCCVGAPLSSKGYVQSKPRLSPSPTTLLTPSLEMIKAKARPWC